MAAILCFWPMFSAIFAASSVSSLRTSLSSPPRPLSLSGISFSRRRFSCILPSLSCSALSKKASSAATASSPKAAASSKTLSFSRMAVHCCQSSFFRTDIHCRPFPFSQSGIFSKRSETSQRLSKSSLALSRSLPLMPSRSFSDSLFCSCAAASSCSFCFSSASRRRLSSTSPLSVRPVAASASRHRAKAPKTDSASSSCASKHSAGQFTAPCRVPFPVSSQASLSISCAFFASLSSCLPAVSIMPRRPAACSLFSAISPASLFLSSSPLAAAASSSSSSLLSFSASSNRLRH